MIYILEFSSGNLIFLLVCRQHPRFLDAILVKVIECKEKFQIRDVGLSILDGLLVLVLYPRLAVCFLPLVSCHIISEVPQDSFPFHPAELSWENKFWRNQEKIDGSG